MQTDIKPKTPNLYFQQLFPSHTAQYGPAFLELYETFCDGFTRVTPISINVDFFASIFSDPSLNMSVVYFEPEMQFYYYEPFQNIYKPVSAEKLQNLYRGFLLRAAQSLNNDVNKLNLFVEFRSDKVAKQVTNRAKSVLAADSSFFSASSPHQRIRGIELHERLILKLVETMLEPREGSILTVTQAYQIFCQMSKQRSLDTIKRSVFRELMRDYIRGRFNLALRHDVPDSENKHQQAWKGLAVVEAEALAA
jgi:hypothetical protein